jgi:hypothetical protein
VAGKRRARTIVELWEFENVPVPVPFVDVGTGKYVYPELRVPIDSKRIVYDGAVIGRDVVRMLFNVPVTAPGSMPRSWRSFMTRGMSISST